MQSQPRQRCPRMNIDVDLTALILHIMIPKLVRFIKTLPKSANGKIAMRELIAEDVKTYSEVLS